MDSGDVDGDQPDVPMAGELCYPYAYSEHWSSPLNVTFRDPAIWGIKVQFHADYLDLRRFRILGPV